MLASPLLVLTELTWDPLVPEAKVGVAVSEGVVTLTGHLDTYAEKIAAKRAVERVTGVKAIALEMEVVPQGVHARSDTEIALAGIVTMEDVLLLLTRELANLTSGIAGARDREVRERA